MLSRQNLALFRGKSHGYIDFLLTQKEGLSGCSSLYIGIFPAPGGQRSSESFLKVTSLLFLKSNYLQAINNRMDD